MTAFTLACVALSFEVDPIFSHERGASTFVARPRAAVPVVARPRAAEPAVPHARAAEACVAREGVSR